MSEDPGYDDVLGVQCDAPPERQIPTALDEGNLAHPENNPENTDQVEEKTNDDLEGPENLTAAYDRNPGEGTADGDVKSTTVPASHESKQLSREEKKPEKDVRSDESPAASGEQTKAGEPSFLVAEDTNIKVAAPSPRISSLSVPNVTEEVELPAASNAGTPLEIACETEIVSEGEDSEDASIETEDSEDAKDEEVEKLWEDAIRSQSVDELLGILENKPSRLVKLEKKAKKRGRTALHIAAKSDHLTLVQRILDQLLESRQVMYTDKILSDRPFYDKKEQFGTVGEYIRAVEKDSKRTATELAKEEHPRVLEYINDIQKCSAAHKKIDEDVSIFDQSCRGYDKEMFKTADREKRGRVERWLSEAIASRDCTLLMEILHNLLSQPTEGPWEDDCWKFKDESSRTMLHVAAMQGCFPLARRLLDRARERNDRDYIEAVDGLSGLTAFQMANDVIGNRSIVEYTTNTLELMKNEKYEHPCFFEAYPRTEWCEALITGSSLLEFLFLFNLQLLLETYKGMTVLHVAILCKNHNIVQALLDIFGKEKKISFGDSQYPSELTWQQMLHKEVEIDGSLFEGVGSEMFLILAVERPSFTRPFGGSAMDLVHFMKSNKGNDDADEELENLALLLENYDKATIGNSVFPEGSSTVKSGNSVLETLSELKSTIENLWKAEWDKGYKADVDFNFEAEPRLTVLKVHYACKHPLKFKEFLKSMSSCEDFELSYRYVQDAQGRTMYHILLDYCDNQDQYPGRWVINEIFEDTFGLRFVRDARGRALADIFLMKNYLQYNILLENNEVLQYDTSYSSHVDDGNKGDKKVDIFGHVQFAYDSKNNNDYVVCAMFYHVATFLKQTNVAQHVWSKILEENPEALKLELSEFKEVPFIAASTGNQVILRLLMENLVDLTVTDAKARTLLHHAANPTLLEFDVLLKCPMILHCFSTMKDLYEVKRKWNSERKKALMTFPLPQSEKDFNMENFITRINVERKACILLLLQAGVDLSQEDNGKKVPNIGPTNDANYQSWWYDMVVKDSTDRKNSFNQAASALSVVGTLVAATSYIGPLQPPMNYTQPDGLVHTSEKLIKMFMVTNTLAFYLAMTSVIFAVVPSLPMPQESALLELKRAQHIVTLSLYILLTSIVSIILSFGAASMVVMQDHHSFPGSDLLFFPSIIGCFFCLIAIVSFLRRVMRLTFYSSPTIKCIYQYSFTRACKDVLQLAVDLASSIKTFLEKFF